MSCDINTWGEIKQQAWAAKTGLASRISHSNNGFGDEHDTHFDRLPEQHGMHKGHGAPHGGNLSAARGKRVRSGRRQPGSGLARPENMFSGRGNSNQTPSDPSVYLEAGSRCPAVLGNCCSSRCTAKAAKGTIKDPMLGGRWPGRGGRYCRNKQKGPIKNNRLPWVTTDKSHDRC